MFDGIDTTKLTSTLTAHLTWDFVHRLQDITSMKIVLKGVVAGEDAADDVKQKLGALPGVMGILQTVETVKLLIGAGEPLIGRLLLYDALHMSFQEVKIRWDADCPVCGKEPTITELIDYEQFCGVPARPE